MGRFEGKVALVTGGARGIGGAIVARLTSEGARAVVADLNPPRESSDAIVFVQTDVTRGDQAAAAVQTAIDRWGRLDILVNNAGVGSLGESADLDEAVWDDVFAVNTRGVFLMCKHAIPAMRQTGGGAIVNIASISGLLADYAMDAYNASKAAVVNYTRSLALNGARDGIRVNAVCPGLVATDMATAAIADADDRAFWFDRIPLGRAARPDEMASVVAFLASDDASYMTGAIVAADGGITAHTGQPNFPARRRLRVSRQG